jgi:hypothetical protein
MKSSSTDEPYPDYKRDLNLERLLRWRGLRLEIPESLLQMSIQIEAK